MNEPDLMFLDPLTFVFYTSCVGAFLSGVRLSTYLGAPRGQSTHTSISSPIGIVYLVVPVLFATVCCFIYLTLLGGKIDFMSMLVSQQAETIKLANINGQMAVSGRWSESLTLLTGTLWWFAYRLDQRFLKSSDKYLLYPVLALGAGVNILTCAATASRGNLVPLITGLSAVYLYRKSRAKDVKVAKLLVASIGLMILLVTLCLVFAAFRGATGLRLLIIGLLGYTIVSYNRLAAVLGGIMLSPYQGRGIYLFGFLLKMRDSRLGNILNLDMTYGWPSALQLWHSEFQTTASAGLTPAFIWPGAFGYIYSDIGWWTLIYLFVVGIVVGTLWRRFEVGKPISILLYLWVVYWILNWFATNALFDSAAVALFQWGLLLTVYEALVIEVRSVGVD